MPEESKPSVWIGCLACYNEGRLIGEWYDLDEVAGATIQELHDAVSRPVSDHEELWVFDHENLPIEGECSPLDVAPWSQAYERLGDDLWSAFCAWEHSGDDSSEDGSLEAFEDQYAGRWNSFEDYAKELADGIALLDGVHEEVARYFNWQAWTRDLEQEYATASAPSGGVFIFRSA